MVFRHFFLISFYVILFFDLYNVVFWNDIFSFYLVFYPFILSSFLLKEKNTFIFFWRRKWEFSKIVFDFEDYPIQHTYPEQSFEPYPEQKIPNIWKEKMNSLLSKYRIDYLWYFYRYTNLLTILHKDYYHDWQCSKVIWNYNSLRVVSPCCCTILYDSQFI